MQYPPCPHRTEQLTCLVARHLLQRFEAHSHGSVEIDEPVPHASACEYCVTSVAPRGVNRATVTAAARAIRRRETREQFARHHVDFIHHGESDDVAYTADPLNRSLQGTGPGSQLWRLLAALGVAHSEDCGCLTKARQMNAWGVEGCRAALDEIASWLVDEARRREWPAVVCAAGRWPAKQLVRLAIRRAEKAERAVPTVQKQA